MEVLSCNFFLISNLIWYNLVKLILRNLLRLISRLNSSSVFVNVICDFWKEYIRSSG